MKIDRLRRVQQFLANLEDESWEFAVVADTIQDGHCGTVGCALGWLPNIFPEENLELAYIQTTCTTIYPRRIGREGQLDIEGFFGITETEYEYIFEFIGYPTNNAHDVTRQQVIEHISHVIDGDACVYDN